MKHNIKHEDYKQNDLNFNQEIEKNKVKLNAMLNLNKKLLEQLSPFENK